jgi:hypothetical protein
MTDSQPLAPARPGARLLITGSTLLAAAGALGLAGLGLATVAVGAMVRRRINQMEVPPRELARQQLRQARAAVRAGAGAWRGNGATLHLVEAVPDSREPVGSS